MAINSDMAMTQLLVSQRPSLQNIIVKGDLIIDESNRDSESDIGIGRLFSNRCI
jgi:hypothetical protein